MTKALSIFISYANDQGNGYDLAKLTQSNLQNLGYQVFRDEENIVAGTNWANEIEDEIKRCDLVVLIMSKKIRTSDWVLAEYQYAKELAIPIIPIKSEAMTTPIWLRTIQTLNFTKSQDWDRLERAILSHTKKPLVIQKAVSSKKDEPSPFIVEISTNIKKSILDNENFYKKSLSKISNNGLYIVTCNNNDLVVIDKHKNSLLHTFNGHDNEITACSFSNNSSYVCSSSKDGVVKLWDITTGKCLQTYNLNFDDHDNTINHCIFSPQDDHLLLTGNYSRHQVINLESSKTVARFHGFHLWTYLVKYSPNGKLISTINKLRSLQLWDLSKGDWAGSIDEIDDYGEPRGIGEVNCSFSPDSNLIATITNGAISVWSTRTFKKYTEITTNQKHIVSCAFSDNGEDIMSLDSKGTLKSHNIHTRELIEEKNIGSEVFYSYGFSDNTNYLFFENENKEINLWCTDENRIILKIIKQGAFLTETEKNGRLLIY